MSISATHHHEGDLSDYVIDVFEDAKAYLVKHGCLPQIKDDTRLLVVHDEAQFLATYAIAHFPMPLSFSCTMRTPFFFATQA